MSDRRLIQTAEGSRAEAFGPADWMLLATVGGIWGASFLFIDIGLEAFPPGLVTFGRIVLGLTALVCFPSARTPVEREDWPRIALVGMTWIAIPFLLFPIAQTRVNSALAGMLNALVPVFTAAIAAMLLRRMPGRIQLAGIGIGFLGAAMISWPAIGSGSSSAVGVALIIVATMFYGLAITLSVPLQQRYGGPPVLARALGLATVVTLPIGLWGLPRASFEIGPVLAVAALGILGTGIAYIAMAALVGRAGATRGGVAVYLVPVGAIILGVAFRGDDVHIVQVLGTATVLLGAWLTSRAERRIRR